MSSSEADQALLQPNGLEVESKNESQESGNERPEMAVQMRVDIREVIQTVKQLKSLEILKSALTIFTSYIKLMFFMLLSLVPLFVFMVLYEVKLQKAIVVAPMVLDRPLGTRIISLVLYSNRSSTLNGALSLASAMNDAYTEENKRKTEFYSDVFELCVLFLVVYPFLELYSMTITMKIAAKVHAGEKQTTFKEVFCQIYNLKGPFVTYLYVHLLSSLNLLGVFWVVVNHLIFSGRINPGTWMSPHSFAFGSIEFFIYILSAAVHTAIFIALVYAYLGWSAFWNMGMVISVLGEEAGVGAFGMADYYGRHCRPTGFQLMLGFVALSTVLRLPCLYAGLGDARVLVTCVLIWFVCLGYLVKWVAFVLYFHDCKQQTMEKKNDQVPKAANTV